MPANFFDDQAPDAAPAPEQAMPAADAPVMQPAAAKAVKRNPEFKGNFFGEENDAEQPAPAPAPQSKEAKPHDWSFLKGFVGQSNQLLTLLKRTAATSGAGLAASEDPTNTDLPALQDELYKKWVEPSVQDQANYELPQDASFSDKLFHGFGTTAGMIAQAIASGGAAGEATTAALGGGAAARAAGGAVTMQLPATASAVEVGHQVLAATGDKHAAMVAGVTSYLVNSASGAVPMGVGGKLATRVATAGGAGVAMQEAGRVAQNAAMPEDMQQPWDPKEDALAALTTAPFGIMGHGAPAKPGRVQDAPHTVMDHAQVAAAAMARAEGGDNLDAVGAAIHVNAEVGAHHDAAAVEGARQQTAMELRRQQAMAADEAAQQDIEQGQREQAMNQAEAAKAPEAPATGDVFTAREAEQAGQKEKDFAAARNQQGEQAVEAAKTEDIGAEKGGANEPAPTLAEALPPEQLAALKSLKERRAAETAKPAPGAALFPDAPVSPHMAAESAPKGENVPLKARKAPQEAIKGPEAAPAPGEEEEVPGKGPPPVTAQTLAERRQQALDEKMAAKVRGNASETELKAPNAPAEGQKDGAQPNRLAAIRAAAEKRRPPLQQGVDPAEKLMEEQVRQDAENGQAQRDAEKAQATAGEPAQENRPEPVDTFAGRRAKRAIDITETPIPPRETKQFVARDPKTDEVTGKFNTFEEARAHKDANPDDDITHETTPATLSSNPEAHWFNDRPGAMSLDEAREHLSDLSDAMGPRTLKIHEHTQSDTIPDDLQNMIDNHTARHPGSNIKGVHHEGVAHIFAGSHDAGDAAGLRSTTTHELTHQGIVNMLGPRAGAKYKTVLSGIGRAVKDTPWAKEYADERGLNLSSVHHQAFLGDEYAAHMAQNVSEGRPVHEGMGLAASQVQSHWNRIVSAIRGWLHDKGIGTHWNDRTIANFIRDAQRHVGGDPLGAGGKELPTFSTSRPGENNPRELKPAQRNASLKSFKDSFGDKAEWIKDKGRSAYLGVLPFRNLPDHVDGRLMPAAAELDRLRMQVQGRTGQLNIADEKLRSQWNDWSNKNPELGAKLDDLIHRATLAQSDPSKPFAYRYSDADRSTSEKKAIADELRRSAHVNDLAPSYKELGKDGQQLYKDIRDRYKEHRDMQDNALDQRAKDMGLDDPKRQQLMALLRKTMESGRITPYAPLMRFGDHWAVAKDAEGNTVSYSQFDTRRQRQDWAEEMQRQGNKVDSGKDLADNRATVERVNPKFMKDVLDIVGDHPDAHGLTEAIWQKYMDSLPDQSYRKNRMPRSGIAGFSGNARRVFAAYTQRSAGAISGLEHEHLIDAKYSELKDQAHALEQKANSDPKFQRESDWGHSVTEAIGKHIQSMRNPNNSPVANALTNFGFHYMLGANAGTVARIGMQQWISGFPYMRSRFGTIGAVRQLGAAMGQFAKSRGNFSDTLRGPERLAFDQMNQMGVFQNLSSHSLSSAAKGDPMLTSDDPGGWRKAAATAAKASQFAFNGVENFNRQSTAMAAYRLASKSMPHDAAVQEAIQASQSTHFEYHPSNRPLLLKGPVGKVAGLFAQYGINQLYQLTRNARDGYFPNAARTAAEKSTARRYFNGMMLMSTLAAGAGNLASPAFWIYDALEGTNDDPVDSKAEFGQYLKDNIGKFGSDSVMHGVVSATTRASFASLNPWDLAYRAPTRTESAKQQAMEAVSSRLGGPIVSTALDAVQGVSQLAQGNVGRGLEHLAPLGVRGALKAARFANEGVRSPNALPGAETLPQGELNPYELALQALNLTPEKLANAYEEGNARANMKSAIFKRGDDILNHLALAEGHGDAKEIDLASQERADFLAVHPGLAKELSDGKVGERIKGALMSTGGVTNPKSLMGDPSMTRLGGE